MTVSISRRSILASYVAVATTGFAGKTVAQANLQVNTSSDVFIQTPDFQYSCQKTDAEWRTQLTEVEYRILREGKTEKRKSSPLWKEERGGTYQCKGCDLLIYASNYKVKLNKGWAFFRQSEPDSVLLGIDLVTTYGGREKNGSVTEVHCRRCGSHFGHILYVKGEILHCINGASLNFEAV
jgi:peptide-methionine (R)-S-oxide reductase